MARLFYNTCDVPGCEERTEPTKTNGELIAEGWGTAEVSRFGKQPMQSQMLSVCVCPKHQKQVSELLGIKFPPFPES